MEELRNLRQIYSLAAGRFNQYLGEDFILPQIFKDQVKEINSNVINYNKYSAVIETRGNQNGVLNIYMPNQWFYIASYFTDFYNELQKYKSYALKAVSRERLKDLNGSSLTDTEQDSIKRLDIDEQSQKYLIRFITDYSWWSGAKTIDRGDFYVSPILNSARLVNASQSFVADLCAFLADKTDLVNAIISGEGASINNNSITIKSRQQIFYGAPGTGKSNTIKYEVDDQGKKCFRTTFHPDSDYSTFVGTYKPSMKPTGVTLASGEREEVITYKFVPQAFTRAYVEAWKTTEDVFLVIEEINRGNCAQIFGDLFQLLDRKGGVSEYPVEADTDLENYLADALADSQRQDIPQDVRNGRKLMLPSNLYIWATMNTSDQSLFPIDSAFKRRWEWKYIPIDTQKEKWSIVAEGVKYSWTSFLNIVNERVFKATSSEDKQMGFYFCKAQNNEISADTFVSKVLFYLWNDVFKDYDEGESIFKDVDGNKLPFSKFYKADGSVDSAMVTKLLTALEIEILGVSEENTDSGAEEELEDEDGNTSSEKGRDYSKFSINAVGRYPKNRLACECMKKYIELNPTMSVEAVLANWRELGMIVPHFVESKAEFDARTDNSKRSEEIKCGGSVLYVAHNGYGSNGKVYELISAVNAQNWGLTLAKVS